MNISKIRSIVGMNLNFDFFVLLLYLAFFSFWQVVFSKTAYTWPSTDMIPFYKFMDGHKTIDFYSNTWYQFNPRWVFGFVIYGTSLLLSSFYKSMFIWKFVVFIFYPLLLHYTIVLKLKQVVLTVTDKILLNGIVFVLIIVLLVPEFASFFTIAWWSPLNLSGITSSSFSSFVVLIAFILKERQLRVGVFLIPFLLLFSGLVHPAQGLFTVLFINTLNLISWNFRLRTLLSDLIFTFLLPSIFFFITANESNQLSTNDFIEIYIQNSHAPHYNVWYFELQSVFHELPWFVPWASVFTLTFLLSFLLKDRFLAILASRLLIFFASVLILHQFLVFTIHIKFFAILGITRFSSWFYFIFWFAIIHHFFKYYSSRFLKSDLSIFIKTIILRMYDYKLIVFTSLLLITFFAINRIEFDSPKMSFKKRNQELDAFISKLPRETMFCSNDFGLIQDLNYLYDFPVFFGNGFPMNAKFFHEYDSRNRFLFGSRYERDSYGLLHEHERTEKYFSTLRLQDFIRISSIYGIDYLVVAKSSSFKLKELSPVLSTDNFIVYRIPK
jgi:hypothetical protein